MISPEGAVAILGNTAGSDQNFPSQDAVSVGVDPSGALYVMGPGTPGLDEVVWKGIPATGMNVPVITSSLTPIGVAQGRSFSYLITATNSPLGYNATNLPPGLTLNYSTGLITGTLESVSNGSSYPITLSATNAGGTGTAALTINVVQGAPAISSSSTATAVVGIAFSYQIAASNSPTSYRAINLPTWASVNSSTGIISGTPTTAGTSVVTILATGPGGTGSAALTGTVSTLAGLPGSAGSADGAGSAALFDSPAGVAVDSSGNVYVADTGNDTIREINPAGAVTTLAGLPGGIGSANGSGSTARFDDPSGIAFGSVGDVYVADTGNNEIRVGIVPVTPPTITSQPPSTTTTVGGFFTLSVSASGGGSLAYQWYFNGSAISGQTNSTYTQGNAQTTETGSYTVVVTNAGGSMTSSVATVTVTQPSTSSGGGNNGGGGGGGGGGAPSLWFYGALALLSVARLASKQHNISQV